ncbi:MAG: hypothetical protein ACTSYI_15985 [Promethearchaeota archaeon]
MTPKSILKTGNVKDDFTIDITTITDLKIKALYKSHTETANINLEFQLSFDTKHEISLDLLPSFASQI